MKTTELVSRLIWNSSMFNQLRELQLRPLALGLLASAVFCTQALGQVASDVAPQVSPLPQGEQGPPVAGPATAEYILGPEDVIEVEIVGQPDKMRARVYTDGTVQLNLIGKISASGKTPRQLGDEIAAKLRQGGFYASPVVNVEVSNYASRYVTVLGAVGSPSLVPINRAYRLSEIVARVGGVRPDAADYLIIRSESGEERRYLIEEMSTGDESKDPFVSPGDKIFAPNAEIFYVSGQVNAPGPFAMKTGITVRQAIARAGGLTPSGSEKKVHVTRGGEKVKLSPDAPIKAGDVLVVGERLF